MFPATKCPEQVERIDIGEKSRSFVAGSSSTILTLTIDDLGNTGAGGPLTDSDTATINIVTAENDAPTATIIPDSYNVDENTTLVLQGTGLSVSDPDAGGTIVQATLSVGE